MTITTNRLHVVFNIKAIERDFVFVQFERENGKQWRGAPQLDQLLGDKYQARAVLFEYGKYAFAMFKRPVDEYQLIQDLGLDGQFNENSIKIVVPRTSRSEAPDVICEAWLAQILLNSLSASTSRHASFHFCNLTGKCILVPKTGKRSPDYLDAFRISISFEWLLNVHVERYRKLISCLKDKKKFNDKHNFSSDPKYAYHEGTSTLKRVFSSKNKSDAKKEYVKRGMRNKEASVPFIDFGSLEGFEKSRADAIYDVLSLLESKLGEYMRVDLVKRDHFEAMDLDHTIMHKPSVLLKRIGDEKIKIVDKVGTSESNDMGQSLNKELTAYFPEGSVSWGDTEDPACLNLCIIHDKEYYTLRGKTDPHRVLSPGIRVQHITIESSRNVSKPLTKTLVKELLIKRDLEDGRITLFDWPQLNFQKPWSFAAFSQGKEHLVVMEINPDGTFVFQDYNAVGNLVGCNCYDGVIRDCLEYADPVHKNEWKGQRFLEGFVISDGGNINAVIRTDELGLPPLQEIHDQLKNVSTPFPASLDTAEKLADMVSECFGVIEDKKITRFIDFLHQIGPEPVSKTDFRREMNHCLGKNAKITKQLRAYCERKYDVSLIFSKQKDRLNRLFNSNLDIKYFSNGDDESCYMVGERKKNVQYSFHRACHLRKVVPVNGSKLIFHDILPTLNVDFVRTGQSTVLPFPFKYIREYAICLNTLATK